MSNDIKIIGHEKTRQKLNNLLITNKVGHAYLFYGKSGIGKKLVAYEFAKKIMCVESNNGMYCNACESCKTFPNNSDFIIIEPEKNVIKVDEIRNLANEIYLKPTKAKRKCFIINDSDLMNDSAQNALLKVLEEPPLYATIILIASNKEKLLSTIKSRVTMINFEALKKSELIKILGEDFDKEIISLSRGSVERALSIVNENYISVSNSLYDVILTKDFLKINRQLEDIKSDKKLKDNLEKILETTLLICYKNLNKNIIEMIRIIDIINETSNALRRNANLDLALDNMIVEICF